MAIALQQFADPVRGQSVTEVDVASAVPNVLVHNPVLPRAVPPPRNPDGHPDLTGMWDFLTGIPVQRPPEFGDRLFMTVEEATTFYEYVKESTNTDLETPGTLLNETENVDIKALENAASAVQMGGAIRLDRRGRRRAVVG